MAAKSINMKLRRNRPTGTTGAAVKKLLKENRCRDCAVVVTRMDFAKILGKHNKVKIQYENISLNAPEKPATETRLKRNENGMVHIPRSSYTKHPVKDILSPKRKTNVSENNNNKSTIQVKKLAKLLPPQKPNKSKKEIANKGVNNKKDEAFYISFKTKRIRSKEKENKVKLFDLLPLISKTILPNPSWTIDYLPDLGEPMNDKVYDKIAAELEDLMNSDVNKIKPTNSVIHSDDLPSIMDILNDNPKDDKSLFTTDPKSDLASSDIEAMLLGNSSPAQPIKNESSQDGSAFSNDEKTSQDSYPSTMDEPGSPSIFDQKLQKEESESEPKSSNTLCNGISFDEEKRSKFKAVTHLIFKQFTGAACTKSVTFPRNLTYKIEIDGKIVELLAAPKFVQSVSDIRCLLEILNVTNLSTDYVDLL